MKLSDFDYNLPPELIATQPASQRDQSRLLVLAKESGELTHRHFADIVDYLQDGDLLIANNSRVIPARLLGHKTSGGAVEIFLSKNLGELWECLIKGRVQAGLQIILSERLSAILEHPSEEATWLVRFSLAGTELMNELERVGQIPLPPYIIKQRAEQDIKIDDKISYQTVYADAEHKGSVAAPTAGLHFTPKLIEKLQAKGVAVEYLTLHVGLGTFLPVKTDNIEEHKIHSEWAEVSVELLAKIKTTKEAGGRVIAVGTTTTRTLEYVFSQLAANQKEQFNQAGDFAAWVDIFIYPPYQFRVVDALITNFHLPKSTLLMLVAALAGKTNIDRAYQIAIAERYRFYSYGDAMLIV